MPLALAAPVARDEPMTDVFDREAEAFAVQGDPMAATSLDA
jgi:hypothetical protein